MRDAIVGLCFVPAIGYPELKSLKTSNAAECFTRFIRERLGLMRGADTEKTLKYWLDVILREHPEIHCT